MRAVNRLSLSTVLIAVIGLAVTVPATALTKEAAIAKCKETVGKPAFRACMQAGGDPKSCKAKLPPKVKACVRAAFGL